MSIVVALFYAVRQIATLPKNRWMSFTVQTSVRGKNVEVTTGRDISVTHYSGNVRLALSVSAIHLAWRTKFWILSTPITYCTTR